ncbi:MAG TPA: choice-of-anchor tandem repeat GloVer-containing protein [Chthonomonadaceae bacterium]|nr:choice-of-anchor tandem repeat GloVer-containing protein [Chthonomonadaceae bacterium]
MFTRRIGSVKAFFCILGLVCLPQRVTQASETILRSFSNNYLSDAYPVGQLAVYGGAFYGVTYGGFNSTTGTFNSAGIFKMSATGAITVLHELTGTEGSAPYSGLTLANGAFYGVMSYTDQYGDGLGTLYKIAPNGSFTVVHTFTGYNSANPPASDGAFPFGKLTLTSDGKLYGITSGGGAYNTISGFSGDGALFSYDPTTGTYTVLHFFNNNTDGGCSPAFALAEGPDGALYGMIQHFNSSSVVDYDTIYKINKNGTGYTLVHTFPTNGSDPAGLYPYSDLIKASDGNLYGTCMEGGIYNAGTVFKLVPSTGSVTLLYAFDGDTGAYPDSIFFGNRLLQGTDGNLYGVTYQGGYYGYGTAFKLSLSGAFSVLSDFNYNNACGSPNPLIQSGTSFYMTSFNGGIFSDPPGFYGYGASLSINSTGVIKVVQSFHQQDSYFPFTSLVQDGSYFYGEGLEGGEYGNGAIYKIDSSGHYTILHHFHDDQKYSWEGNGPQGGLLLARDGNLYGMTSSGGLYNNGTLFKISAKGAYTVLHHFRNSDGNTPIGALVQGVYPDNNLYGALVNGGLYNAPHGTVFSTDTAGKNFKVIWYFTGQDGSGPECTPVPDGSGFLYGACSGGGANFAGTVWKVSTNGASFSTLADFDGTHGAIATGQLAIVNGSLYGTTLNGGANNQGVVFACNLSTHALSVVHTFNNSLGEGFSPTGGLTYDAASGNFYGTCTYGGVFKYGTTFKLNLSSGAYTVLYAFTGSGNQDGQYPQYAPILGSDGWLYGTTPQGGLYNYYGTAYKQTTTP